MFGFVPKPGSSVTVLSHPQKSDYPERGSSRVNMNHKRATEAASPARHTASDVNGFARGSRLLMGMGESPNQACRAQQS